MDISNLALLKLSLSSQVLARQKSDYSGSQARVRGAVGEPHPRPLSKREGSLMTITPA